jgi:hypothetical protein
MPSNSFYRFVFVSVKGEEGETFLSEEVCVTL